ncbi:MAG: aspartate-semialdehyde dehydrogenase [Alphaproteobacteria bacterium]|nr:aspartate-semialdehyde dehydrogenase [Alphaproteobacteria bacterium]
MSEVQTLNRNGRIRALPPSPSVAVVGATGAVGTEMIACLERRNFPLSRLKLLASPRSAGKHVTFQNRDVRIDAMEATSLEDVDIALFSAGSAISKDFAKSAPRRTVVIDNSSAFRMDDDVPLVVPEINAAAAFDHHGVIANPNCTAVISALALWPLHREAKIRRVIAATYQAASGAGASAMEELRASTQAYLEGRPYEPRVLPHPYAFNVFSHNDKVDLESGANGEEIKVARELRKIMNAPDLRIAITCVRVPVLRAHTIALTVEFDRALSVEAAREILSTAPGVKIIDDRAKNYFPMPRDASGQDDVLVGRLRPDPSDPTGRSLMMLVAGDQLLKGAALNAVQIAELLMKRA